MSTNVLTEPERSARALPIPRRIRYRVGAAVVGLAAAGSVALLLTAADSTTTEPRPAPATPQATFVVPAPPLSPSSEVFAGCLNDVECYGEPSFLPPGYWDPPIVASVD